MSATYVSTERRVSALGRPPADVQFALRRIEEFFSPLPKPGPADWLASQKEPGQTVSDYIHKARHPTPTQSTIYIQPLDPQIDSEMLSFLQQFASAYFHPTPVSVLPSLQLDQLGVPSRINLT